MTVIVRNHLRRWSVRRSAFKHVAQRLLESIGEGNSELSVVFVGDSRIRRLNREFRDVDRTTDVLAFALREASGPSTNLLGDIVLSIPTAVRQASDQGHSLDEEITRLLIHGLLHLVGYDHEKGEREARRMRRKETTMWKGVQPLPRMVKSNE